MPIQHIIDDTRVPAFLWTPINEVESGAIDQIRNVANLPFVFDHVAIMPDVHQGFGATIGSVMATEDVVVPSSVGVDIGCGMCALKTPFDVDKVKAILPAIKHSIERSIPTGFNQHKDAVNMNWSGYDEIKGHKFLEKARAQMGTLGGGNHFIEISTDENNAVWVMLHSGSRHIGLQVANEFIAIAKGIMKDDNIKLSDPQLAYLQMDWNEGKEYLKMAQWCQSYAMENRKTMMGLVLKDLVHALGKTDTNPFDMKDMVNCHHNYVELERHFERDVYVTRKGAIRVNDGELAIIPGSMGTASFIVKGKGNVPSFRSASHGAGRKMSRKAAKKAFTMEDFKKQMDGILCTDSPSVLDEIPGAYKSIEQVMQYQVDLVEPIHTLHQLLCIKGVD